MHWTIRGDGEGDADIEYLLLAEVDAAGHVVAAIAFDLDDRGAAENEADRRWLAQALAWSSHDPVVEGLALRSGAGACPPP